MFNRNVRSGKVADSRIAGKSIERRAFAGAVAGGANFFVTLLQSVILVPIILSAWTREQYGIWLSLSSLAVMLATLDLGHQNYVGNQYNKILHLVGDGIKPMLASGVKMACLLGGIQLAIALVLVATDFLPSIIGLHGQKENLNLNLAFLLIIFTSVFIGSIGGIVTRVYIPYGKYAESQWLGVGQRLGQFGVTVLVVAAGGYLLSYSIGNFLFMMSYAAFGYIYLYRTFPHLYPWWSGGSWKIAFRNFTCSLVLTANAIVAQMANSGLTLLLASQFTVEMVPLFTTVRTVANIFSQASMVLTNPLLPDLVRFHVNGEIGKLRHAFQACWFSGGAIINVGLVVAVPFIPKVYQIWTHGKLSFDVGLFALLAWSVALRSAYSPLASYITGLNHLRAQSIINGVQSIVVIGAAFILSSRLGLSAFGVGIVLGEIIGACGYSWFAALELGGEKGRFVRTYVSQALAPVAVVGAVFASTCVGSDRVVLLATGSGVIILGAFYLRMWFQLPNELKARFLCLLPGPLRSRWTIL